MRKVTITGNKHLKKSAITGIMRTAEKGWLSWFTGSGILDEEVLEEDRKNIEAFTTITATSGLRWTGR